MNLDPQVARFLAEFYELGAPPVDECTPDEAREMLRVSSNLDAPREPVARVVDFPVPSAGGAITVRHYAAQPQPQRPTAGIVFFHGGGWVCGDLDTHDAFCRRVANATGHAVLAVDYRRAPESPWPAAAEDCYAATEWIRGHAAELSLDPARLVLCGDSAGGNLVAAVTLMARTRQAPQPALQVLLYPVADADFERASYREFQEGYLLTRDAMRWFWNCYVPEPSDRQNPLAAPLKTPDFSGLPPAVVITAQYDVLRDEGDAYAERLKHAGVEVEHTCYPGMIHGFMHRFAIFDVANTAIEQVTRRLAKL